MLLVGLTCLAHRVAAAPGGLSPAVSAEEQVPRLGRNVLLGGWYPWDPYQYREDRHGVQILTGFDVEIERALERVMGVELILTDRAWDQHLAAIAAGTADITAGATYSPERNRYAYFSKPYRRETDVLVVRKGASAKYPFRSIEQMLDLFRKQRFRLGVIAGYVYADERVNEFIADPANNNLIVRVPDDRQNLENLLHRSIDGFLADRIVATTVAWRQHQSALIEEHPFRFSTDIHFMLSRVSQTPAMLARLNAAIDQIKVSGEFRRIADAYALPILIHQTLDSDWFEILLFLGSVAFALSGVVLAYAGRSTIFGAMVLASLPALGGGVVTDLLLQRQPLGIVRDPLILLAVFGTVLVGMLVIKAVSLAGANHFVQSLQSSGQLGTHLIEVFDAVGLAASTVAGVVVVLETSVQPLWLWGPISACISGSFGGLLRDLFRRDHLIPSLQGELYPEIALIWGLALSLFLQWEAARLQPEEILLGVIITILGAFLTRILAIIYRLKGWPYVLAGNTPVSPERTVPLLSFPTNPTGGVLKSDDLRPIREACIKHDLLVLSDEIHSELVDDGSQHVSIASLPGMRERTVLLNGCSKSFAMTGFRVGYACAPPPIIGAMTKIHQTPSCAPPTPPRKPLFEALENCDRDADHSAIA